MSVQFTACRFDHQRGGDYPGDRGTFIEATRPGAPGFAFSIDFPGIWLTDSGSVEIDEPGGRYPAEDLAEWFETVAARIRESMSAAPVAHLDPTREPVHVSSVLDDLFAQWGAK